MKLFVILFVFMCGCQSMKRFSTVDKAKVKRMTAEEIEKSLCGAGPDVISISLVHWIPCKRLCLSNPYNVIRDFRSEAFTCVCVNGARTTLVVVRGPH